MVVERKDERDSSKYAVIAGLSRSYDRPSKSALIMSETLIVRCALYPLLGQMVSK